jgi:hypothetical protein
MKRIGLMVLMLAAVCAISGAMTSTAMASVCVEVEEPSTGRWNDAQCTKEGGEKRFIGIQRLTANLGQGQWCAEVESGEVGKWEDAQCTHANAAGRFIKVRLRGPYWYVGGKQLKQGVKQVKFQAKLAPILSTEIKAFGIKVVVECHNSYSEGASIEGQGAFQGQDKGRVVFEQCKTVFNPEETCKVVEPIKTNQLKSFLAYNPNSKQQKFVDVFEPTQKAPFVVLHFTGAGCIVTEAAVEGALAAEIVPVEKESQELIADFPEKPITEIEHEQLLRKIGLTFAGEPAVFDGVYGARLETNEPWGVFGV